MLWIDPTGHEISTSKYATIQRELIHRQKLPHLLQYPFQKEYKKAANHPSEWDSQVSIYE